MRVFITTGKKKRHSLKKNIPTKFEILEYINVYFFLLSLEGLNPTLHLIFYYQAVIWCEIPSHECNSIWWFSIWWLFFEGKGIVGSVLCQHKVPDSISNTPWTGYDGFRVKSSQHLGSEVEGILRPASDS